MTINDIPPQMIPKALAVVGAFIAMITDMRQGKIYNWLTFPLIFIGWGLNAYLGGFKGFGISLAATAIGIGFYMGFAMVGGIGMGDVKLLAAIGSLGGIKFVVSVFLYTSVIGIPHALIVQFLNYGKNALGMLFASIVSQAFREKTIHTDNQENQYHYYLGLDIWLGTILAVFFEIPLGF